MTLFQAAGPQFQPGILDEIFDLVGLDANQLKESASQQQQAQAAGLPGPNPQAAQQPGQPQGQPQPFGPQAQMQQTPQPQMQQAMTMQNAQ